MSLIIHKNINEKLNNFIENKKIPNLIFHGSSGSGKKTLLYNFLKKVYNNEKSYMKNYMMTVNCAHGKGIKFIREELKFFARTNINLQDGDIFKSIIWTSNICLYPYILQDAPTGLIGIILSLIYNS